LQKSGISGNAYAIEEILELPRQLGEFLNFLQTFNSGKQQNNKKKSTFKTKLSYPNLT